MRRYGIVSRPQTIDPFGGSGIVIGMVRRAARSVITLAFGMLLLLRAPPVVAGSPAPTDAAVRAIQKGDFKSALAELNPLAAKGDANAQFMLGMMYDAGRGVRQDQAIAAAWYRKAADRGHLPSQLYLGILYSTGEGVKQDYKEAARWFKAPADSGNDQAQFYLGSLYANGAGVKKDEDEAIRLLTKSAAQQNPRAMGLLATTLFSRSRDDQDRVDAYVWSHLAAEYDPIQAQTSARAVIEKYCNDDQKKRAKKAMNDWKRRWAKE
jgi:TPR repeat protein